jgi:ubiquinone/menaquinone biosynthesis C-methylase UbiE
MKRYWTEYDVRFIQRRYDRIARYFNVFEWLFLLPPGARARAVDRLHLKPGQRVLEIGCGTGRNLSLLREAVGPTGHVYGVDLSEAMLSRAIALCNNRNWSNVSLVRADAAEYEPPGLVDGVLFSLSIATMPHHREVLRRAWSKLGEGASLVILDSKLPPGIRGRQLLPFAIWLSERSVLGNPLIRPWEDVAELTADIEMEEFLFGSYYICRGIKR